LVVVIIAPVVVVDAPVIIVVVVVLRVVGVTIIGAGSPGGFLLERDILLQ
jgi:hypothetical protein